MMRLYDLLDYLLFEVETAFYMKPAAKFKALNDNEAREIAGFFMHSPDGIYRLYRQLDYGVVFIACWQDGITLDEGQFLDAYFEKFPPKPIAEVLAHTLRLEG